MDQVAEATEVFCDSSSLPLKEGGLYVDGYIDDRLNYCRVHGIGEHSFAVYYMNGRRMLINQNPRYFAAKLIPVSKQGIEQELANFERRASFMRGALKGF